MLDDVTALGVFSVLYIIITYYYFRALKMMFGKDGYDKEHLSWFAIIHVFLTLVFFDITKVEQIMAWVNIPGLMSPPVRKTETVIPDKKKLQIPDFGNRLDL